MSTGLSILKLWRSLNFTARLAGLTSLLIILTIPLTVGAASTTTNINPQAYVPEPTPPPTHPIPTPTPIVTLMGKIAYPRLVTRTLPPVTLNRNYQATIIGSEANPDTHLMLTLTGLPQNLALGECSSELINHIQTLTCSLSGKVSDLPGSYPLTIKLSDNHNSASTSTLILVVTPDWLYRLTHLFG